jgi:hypothetical protein
MVAVDKDGLGSLMGGGSQINAGFRFTGDREKLSDLYSRVVAVLHSATGEQAPFSKQDFDRGLAIASNDAYARRLAQLGGSLGDSENFQSVVDDGADQQFVLFFNWDLVEDEILTSMESGFGMDPEAQKIADNLRPLRAFGISGQVDGDYGVTHVVVSVDG